VDGDAVTDVDVACAVAIDVVDANTAGSGADPDVEADDISDSVEVIASDISTDAPTALVDVPIDAPMHRTGFLGKETSILVLSPVPRRRQSSFGCIVYCPENAAESLAKAVLLSYCNSTARRNTVLNVRSRIVPPPDTAVNNASQISCSPSPEPDPDARGLVIRRRLGALDELAFFPKALTDDPARFRVAALVEVEVEAANPEPANAVDGLFNVITRAPNDEVLAEDCVSLDLFLGCLGPFAGIESAGEDTVA
jgi:hypothetical protein